MARSHVSARQPDIAEKWLARIRGEYLEMPGLSLTAVQAQRLWGLDGEACGLLLESLLESGFLRRTTQGVYVRASAA
jgi:hypothetical protein